jgi:formylglycine-generating enzyme required for sulfatase activity
MDPYTCDGYRLPTEAEWEGAARCGEDLLFAGGDVAVDVGWYSDNSGSTTHPSALLAPNACGLYDMSGNVSEWTQDLYELTYYASSGRTDPTGASTGTNRVYRGGRWIDRVRYLRVASRRNDGPANAYYVVGFRLARTAP